MHRLLSCLQGLRPKWIALPWGRYRYRGAFAARTDSRRHAVGDEDPDPRAAHDALSGTDADS